MKILKGFGIAALVAVCLAVIAFFGFFLVRGVFPVPAQPKALETGELFVAELPPVEEEATEEEPVEEEPVEEELPAQTQTPDIPQTELALKAQIYLDTMTMEEKLWQLFYTTADDLTGVPGATQAGDTTKQAIKDRPVGGLCYFSANLEDREQITSLLTGTASYAEIPMFLGVDEEGGMVSRLSAVEDLGISNIGAAADFGAAGDQASVYAAGKTLAGQMKELGFNMDFAPVADLYTEGNTEIGSRAYSSDPQVAGSFAASMASALQEGGITACLKHFPGHGSAQTDSHEGKAVSTRTLEQLRQEEWLSFRAGIDAGVKFVMMSHLTNENLSPLPSSLSAETVGLLRNELGFEGVIITDSLKMGAIVNEYTSAQAAVMAIQAGCDMLLMPNDLQTAYDGLVAAVMDGTLTENRIDESVLRILTVKYEMGMME